HLSIEVRGDIPQGLGLAPLAEHCLTQAVLNMVNNASDAIGSGRPGLIVVSALQESDWLTLSVADNGPGMTEEVKARGIEPFFTTKPYTMSTGLGLAIVHSLAAKAGGRVEIETSRGEGATISMIMPVKKSTQEEKPSGRPAAPKPERSSV